MVICIGNIEIFWDKDKNRHVGGVDFSLSHQHLGHFLKKNTFVKKKLSD
jgi:hypothetical protein